ncbi:uncharacterized protein EI97DRAFT_371595, partial [Westerdykella ornata]
MAPVNGSASTAATATNGFEGDEFSNNLFSDLAPLLTLFGEQVTKQFLSLSLGWADNVLLAMGPLGIITTVISAIRVGGVRRLKALVGRAREGLATAERELLSSTSADVCELWSGQEVVRQFGKPQIKELVFYGRTKSEVDKVTDLKGALAGHVLSAGRHELSEEKRDQITSQSPNIALNIEGSTSPPLELWCFAAVGILLQSTALIVPALATYYWSWPKGSSSIQGYAYPCFLAGSLAVILGTMLCSHVIEEVTQEITFEPRQDSSEHIASIMRLQKSFVGSDQTFPPFLIFNEADNNRIRTSRLFRNPHIIWHFVPGNFVLALSKSKLAASASLLTVAGFVCQFVGLRGLHWSATVIQLGVTMIMTGVRSWVRRGLAANPPFIKLEPGKELIWTAKFL